MTENIDDKLAILRRQRLIAELGLRIPLSKAKLASGELAKPSQPSAQDASIKKLSSLEAVLRKQIAQGKKWAQLRPILETIYDHEPSNQSASRILELSFLHGSLTDFLDQFHRLWDQHKDAYFQMSRPLRDKITLELWAHQHQRICDRLFCQESWSETLQPVERLYLVLRQIDRKNFDGAWRNLVRFEEALLFACHGVSAIVKLSVTSSLLRFGRLAIKKNDFDRARYYLERIGKDSLEYSSAIDLLINIEIERDDDGLCRYGRQLNLAKDDKARLDLISRWLDSCIKSAEVKIEERNALNGIFLKLDQWFTRKPEILYQLSQTVCRAVDGEHHLPALLSWLRKEALVFRSPVLARAIWEPVQSIRSVEPEKQDYWRSLALVQTFIGKNCKEPVLLWNARDLLVRAKRTSEKDEARLDWKTISLALQSHIAKSERFDESSRARALLYTRLALEEGAINLRDLTTYLRSYRDIDGRLLEKILETVAASGQTEAELAIIQALATSQGLTNQRLDRLWTLSKTKKSSDYAWRVATVLHHRRALNGDIEKVWSVSGEHRHSRKIKELSEQGIDLLVNPELDHTIRRLLTSLIEVGPLMPELLSIFNPQVRPVRANTLNQQIRENLKVFAQHRWIQKADKIYVKHPEGQFSNALDFLKASSGCAWSYVLETLALKLGFAVWRCDGQWLAGQLDGLMPRLQQSSSQNLRGKLGRWLKALSPSGRKSWYFILDHLDELSSKEFKTATECFFLRMGLAVYPNHSEALNHLSSNHCELNHIRHCESWICSSNYSELRQQLRSRSIIAIPAHLPDSALPQYSRSLSTLV